PVRALRERFAGVLGFGGGLERGDSLSLIRLQRFRCLIRVFGGGVGAAFVDDFHGPEVGEEAVFVLEFSDLRSLCGRGRRGKWSAYEQRKANGDDDPHGQSSLLDRRNESLTVRPANQKERRFAYGTRRSF